MKNFTEYVRKVHLFHDQEGATIKHSGRRFANTLCKMNSDVPESHITSDPDKVTCSICRKDRRFKVLLNAQFGKPKREGEPAAQFVQQYGRTLRTGFVNGMRSRHRRNWRGKLILQVEEIVPYNYDERTDVSPGGYCGRWRDATLEDMGGGVV